MGRTTPNLKAITYLTAKPAKNTARGNWHVMRPGSKVSALCGAWTVYADEQSAREGTARAGQHADITCGKCRSALRHASVLRMPAAAVEEMAHTENARIDREARVAATAARVAERNTRRAPKAVELTDEQVAERVEAGLAAYDARVAAENAARLAELAEQPVPWYATWVFDSATGEKIGYLTQYGVVLLPVEAPVEAPAEAIVIVPCGGKKLEAAAPAGELYVGSYHLAMRRAADAIAARTGARVLILSALHGLLELDQLVEPYNLRMGQPGSVTADQLRQQAAALGVRAAHVTVLAGKDYANAVTAVWPDAVRPMDGTGGMGPQLAVAKRIADGELADQQAPAERPGDTRPTLRLPLVGEQLAVVPAPPLDLLAVGFPRRRLRSGRLVHLGRADRAARLLAGVGL